jgi:D-galactarolactone cycloisomerase
VGDAPARIDRIEVLPLRVPLDRVYSGSHYSMRNRATIVTRVYADGLVGECYNGDTDDEQAAVVKIITDEITPLLVGRDARDVEGGWERMRPATFNILRDRNLALQAMACVDSALWDLVGKALGQPLARVWGGVADTLPINVIGGYYSDDADAVEREGERWLALGFRGCKFKVGGRSPEIDADRLRRLRETVGPAFTVTVDANQGWTLDEAVRFARLAADCGIRWFEEPCRWTNDRQWLRDVRYMTGLAVCAGQSETTGQGVRELIAGGSVDVCNLDASWSGGPTFWRRVAGMAALYGVRMAHHEEPQVAAQLLGGIAHGTYLECFMPERDPLFWTLIANRGSITDGRYPVPRGAGFGIVLDEGTIARGRL